MKKFFATFLCLVLCGGLLPAQAAGPEVNAKAVLLMEKTTGQVLYEEHAHDPLELASVTKVMTMLLIMEALEEGTITKETMVPVSATAAGMGGSQVYMKEGESFSVHDMLKAIAVASGNDACVAMAEYLAGSERLCGKDERQSGGAGHGKHRLCQLHRSARRGTSLLRL